MGRTVREGIPVDKLRLREGDKRRADELREAVKKRLLALAGYTTDVGLTELSPIEQGPARHVAELSREEAELVQELEEQYQQMSAALQRYEIPAEGMPTWKAVRRALTPDVLRKVQRLQEPDLLLISPTTRKFKIEAIEKYPVGAQAYETRADDWEDDNLWSDGTSKDESKWRVAIVEGAKDVEADPDVVNCHDGIAVYAKIATSWARRFEAQGLEVLKGADAYLTLVMKNLAGGNVVDTNTFTLLNAPQLSDPYDWIAYGKWDDGQLCLCTSVSVDISEAYRSSRLRASIEVEVSQA
ncbi:hypothetical protein WME77_19335 [Sorangium sp. So ce764]|uniref:hypothetical protein n=1 Tax=Sorangium sp. So ce764 TaxID=3133320 RepID=UPI003F5FC878